MSGDIPENTLSPDGKFRWGTGGWTPVDAVPPSPGSALAATFPAPAGRSKRRIILGVIGLVVVAAVAATLTLALSGSAQSDATLNAKLTLTGGGGYTTHSPCYGTNNGLVDYSDLNATTQVEVLDATGTIDGTTQLGNGVYSANNRILDAQSGGYGPYTSCTFTFRANLDHSSTHYQLLIGQRPPFNFDDPSSLDLTLGYAHP